ncbi:MAG: hypothetical protein AAFV95_08385 [Bacteroidota bacterium]
MKLKIDSIPSGILIGLAIPAVLYLLLGQLYSLADGNGWISDSGLTENFRLRTMALLAIAGNLLPFTVFNRRWQIKAMRGVIFPTVMYAAIWMIVYGSKLING